MIFNRKATFKMLWPVMLESLLATAAMIISTAMATGISASATSAVGLVNPVNFLFIGLLMAYSSGITVVVSQRIGGGDVKTAGQTAMQAIMALVMGVTVVSVLLALFGNPLIGLLFGGAGTETIAQTNIYFRYIALSMPLWAAYSGLAGLMRATGNNVGPMLASIIGNIALIATIYACRGLGMDIDALGWGMVANRLAAAGVLVFLQWRGIGTIYLSKITFKLKAALLAPVLRISIPASLDAFFFSGTKLLVMVFMADMGDIVLNANMVGSNVAALILLPGGAVMTIVVTMVGQAYGAKRYDEARKYMLKMIGLACLLQTGAALLTLPLMNTLINMNMGQAAQYQDEITSLARTVILLLAATMPLFWAPGFVGPNALRGAGDVRYTVVASLGSLFIVRLFGAWFLGRYLNLGLIGIWLAMAGDWVARSAIFMPRVLGKKWIPKEDEE
ncbi:MAG: MATE family efflux transporter [Oscillospiraceae bacterium]|nr:MATE family efflux transporter [Oscillospiraceae bacterium]